MDYRNSIDTSLRNSQNVSILNTRVTNIENRINQLSSTQFSEEAFDILNNLAKNEQNPFKDKWVSILGDSISTYAGWVPEGNATEYPSQDVTDVTKTWWHKLLTKLGAKLCVNQSWNGRKVADTDSGDDHPSCVKNATNKLHREVGTTYINLDGTTEIATKRQDPDIILILVGINDFNGQIPKGSPTLEGSQEYNDSDFAKSYEAMLMNITGYNYKTAKIYCLNITFASNKFGFLADNGSGASKLYQYRDIIEELASVYECNVIHVNRLGIHSGNIERLFSSDKLHPNAKMMEMIANQCYTEMMASNCL